MNKKQIAITLGIMCFILTMTLVVQVRTINNTNKTVTQTLSDNDLRDQVLKWKERYDNAYAGLQTAEKTLETVRQTATANTEGSTEKEEQLRKNNMLIGLTDVSGEGIIVTLKDDDSVTVDKLGFADDVREHLVHDGDIRSVVNELQNAGAEAISINEQRLVSTTAITCEGNIVSVNGQKISSPFVIKAIGSSVYMYSALTRIGGTIDTYISRGLSASVKKTDNVEIAKYTGVITSKYMKYAN